MRLSSKKGFLLVDSLISVFITSLVCATCYAVFYNIVNYEEGYTNYQARSNDNLENIYNNLYQCEACIIDEFD